MRSKYILIAMILAAALALGACGSKPSGGSDATRFTPGNTTEAETESETETETPDPLDYLIGSRMWVRTSVTVYANDKDAQISGFLKKGTELRVTGHNAALPDGSPDMLSILSGDVSGWVYAKYLAGSEEAALAVYEPVYNIHAGREYTYDLYGGAPENLDWYPVEKEAFPGNPIIQDARTMYFCADVLYSLDAFLELAHDVGVNAICLDIKDYRPICGFDICREMSPSSYDMSMFDIEYVQECTKRIMDEGFYLILRIVTFNDELYGEDHPDECIDSPESYMLWPSAYDRNMWYYNVAMAEEAIELFHPNEIQFDYVRFPESSFAMSDAGNTDFKNTYDEEKAEAVQNFLFYACDRVHSHRVYVSADVFAECASDYVTAYGQYFPAISNIVDAISAMPYTDHYGRQVDTWSYPYSLIYNWACDAVTRQTEIETPAQVRTWLTGYSVPNWDPYIPCDASYVLEEAQALYDAGLYDGFLLWNGASSYGTYANIDYAWSYDYIANAKEPYVPEPPTSESETDEPEYEQVDGDDSADEAYDDGIDEGTDGEDYDEDSYVEDNNEGTGKEAYDKGADEGGIDEGAADDSAEDSYEAGADEEIAQSEGDVHE